MQEHELAGLIPAMTGDEFTALKDDIRAHGVTHPVLVYEGKILDGRHRVRACEQLNITYPVEQFNGDRAAAIDRVISENIKRRHLTVSQRAMIASDIANMKRGGDRRSDQAINLQNDISEADAAKLMNVSTPSVSLAAALKREAAPDVIADVRAGNKSVSGALKETRANPDRKPPPRSVAAPKLKIVDVKKNRVAGIDVKQTPEDWLVFQHIAQEENKTATTKINEMIAELVSGQPRESLSMTAQERFDAALRIEKKRLEAAFEMKMRREIKEHIDNVLLPSYRKKHEEFDRIIKGRNGLMTKAQYRRILACLHPDSVMDPDSKARYAEVFDLFRSLEILLCNERESPTATVALPKTAAELMARRDALDRKRQNAKAV